MTWGFDTMSLLKATWKKEPKRPEVGIEVLDKVAARGSFVIIRDKTLYKTLYKQPKMGLEVKEVKKKFEDLTLEEQINERVMEVNFKIWMENLVDNLPVIKTCKNISHIPKATRRAAIVVGAGPSFEEKGHMELLKEVKNQTIISVDRMFIPLLGVGIIPDIVVSVDGHRQLIVKWYDGPLVDENRGTIGVMAVTVAPNVVKRFPGEKFFFTPLLDELTSPTSLTRAISYMTGAPILSAGANIGITCVNLAAYLGYKNIILTGMDQGYPIELPIEKSQYYPIYKEADPTMTPERYKETFLEYGYNPDFGVKYYTDKVFKYHRDHLVEISNYLAENGVTIINATEGGAVHGGAIIGMPLKEALHKYG
jgi:hypothetical protein